MEKEKIIVGNKLIAEFLHGRKHDQGGIIIPDEICKDYFGDSLKYRESWDWLIPVILKIRKNTPYIRVNNSTTEIIKIISNINRCLLSLNREKTWEAVVKFIEWYNKNKN